MSVSKREPFKHIELGPHEKIIHRMLQSRDPGAQSEFPILVSRFTDTLGMLTMWGPERIKIHGLNVLTIGLPGYRMYIKVDRRPLSPGVLHNCLAPDKPLVILLDRMDIGRPYERIKFVYQNADLSLGLRKKSRYARRIRLSASESKRRQLRPSAASQSARSL